MGSRLLDWVVGIFAGIGLAAIIVTVFGMLLVLVRLM